MRAIALLLILGLAAGCGEDEITDETGSGTVLIHFRVGNSFAAGVQAYIIRDEQSTERRVTSDAQGNALFENVPAASWDVGFSPSAEWVAATGPSRVTVDVRDDATTELTFNVRRP